MTSMRFSFFIIIVLLGSLNMDAQDWEHVIEDRDTTLTIYLEGEAWNNTLIRNCHIHHTEADGIFLRSVSNVRIEHCVIHHIAGQGAIRLSSTGEGTANVQIVNNVIYSTDGDGIVAPQRSQELRPVDQDSLLIKGNEIYNTGLKDTVGLYHAIYCQASDFRIKGNYIHGKRGGNGISVRSSGTISENIITGTSLNNKPGIRYFSDHMNGDSDTLLIENNVVYNSGSQANCIDIFNHAPLYNGDDGTDHIVGNFNIRFNTAVSFQSTYHAIAASKDYGGADYEIAAEGNIAINIINEAYQLSGPSDAYVANNYLSTNLAGFIAENDTFDFHVKVGGPIADFSFSSTNFPQNDIDGDLRLHDSMNAGADQLAIVNALSYEEHATASITMTNPVIEHARLVSNNKEMKVFVQVTNVEGLAVYRGHVTTNQDFDLSHLNPGSYILSAVLNQEIIFQSTFIKK